MCWSGEASAVLAVAGLSTAAYVAYKGRIQRIMDSINIFCLNGIITGFHLCLY